MDDFKYKILITPKNAKEIADKRNSVNGRMQFISDLINDMAFAGLYKIELPLEKDEMDNLKISGYKLSHIEDHIYEICWK